MDKTFSLTLNVLSSFLSRLHSRNLNPMHTKRRLLDMTTTLHIHQFRVFVSALVFLCITTFIGSLATAQSVTFSDSEGRSWSDPSRFYSIKGTLTEFNSKTVKLQLENETIIEVPIDQLHNDDKKYVQAKVTAQKMKAKSAPAISRGSTEKSTRVPFFANQVSLEVGAWSYRPSQKSKSVATAFKSPITIEKAFQDPQLQTGMGKLTFHSMQLSDDGEFCTMVFASEKDGGKLTVLKRVSVANGRTVAETVISGMPLAVSPNGSRVATGKKGWGRTEGYIKIYDVQNPDVVLRNYPTKSSFGSGFAPTQACFINDSVLLMLGDRLVMTDLDHGKGIATTPFDVGGGTIKGFKLSADRSLLAAVANDRIHVFDLLRGEAIGSISSLVPSFGKPQDAVCFSTDNLILAVHKRNVIRLYSLETGEEVKSINATFYNKGIPLVWLDSRFLASKNRIYDREMGLPVWSLETGYGSFSIFEISSNQFLHLTGLSGDVIKATPFSIPVQEVAGQLASIKPADIRPLPTGSRVRLKMTGLPFPQSDIREIRSHLVDEFADMGATLGDEGDYLLTLTVKMGETRTENYKNEYNPLASNPTRRGDPFKKTADGTFTVKPSVLTMRLENPDGKRIWSRQKTNDLRPHKTIRTEENESVQQFVNKKLKIEPSFFKAGFPAEIIRFKNGSDVLGTTDLGSLK